MPNTSYQQAIKEAYASAPSDVVLLDTLIISHPSLPGETKYLINARENYTLTLSDGVTEQEFTAYAFKFKLPPAGDNGVQDLQLVIDNVDRTVSDFLALAKEYRTPAKVIYAPYLSSDLTTPQLDPPLSLNLTDVKVTNFQVSGRATFADLINKKHPLQLYTRSRFPSLGGG